VYRNVSLSAIAAHGEMQLRRKIVMTLEELFEAAPTNSFKALVTITSGKHQTGSYLIPLTYHVDPFVVNEVRFSSTLSGSYQFNSTRTETASIVLTITRSELRTVIVRGTETEPAAPTFSALVLETVSGLGGSREAEIADFVPDTAAAEPICQGAASYFTSGGSSPVILCCVLP
jgi:hypothetical protein